LTSLQESLKPEIGSATWGIRDDRRPVRSVVDRPLDDGESVLVHMAASRVMAVNR
jgi:hypothetical protein